MLFKVNLIKFRPLFQCLSDKSQKTCLSPSFKITIVKKVSFLSAKIRHRFRNLRCQFYFCNVQKNNFKMPEKSEFFKFSFILRLRERKKGDEIANWNSAKFFNIKICNYLWQTVIYATEFCTQIISLIKFNHLSYL